MVLKNDWWLLIWLFLFGGVSFAFIPKQEEYVLGQRCVRWNWVPALILVAPYIMWATFRPGSVGDTGVYIHQFEITPTGLGEIPWYLSTVSKDKGFALLQILFKTMVSRSERPFFFCIAAFQMLSLAKIYRKYSRNFWLSLFFFVSSAEYISWMMNGVRQFLAVTIIFACLPLLLERRYFVTCLVVVLASSIHISALIVLPFVFIVNGRAWNIRTLTFIFGVIAAVFFLDYVTGFISNALQNTAYEGDAIYFDSINDDGTNLFRVLFYSVPPVMAWLFRPYIDRANDQMINLCANLSVVAAGFYVFSYFTSGMIIGRLPIYFSLANYILIPWIIQEVFSSNSVPLIDLGFVSVYTAFFYYQIKAWGA